MTLPTSGSLSMSQINTEFSRGTDLNSYRGTDYYTLNGGPFIFPAIPIRFSDFYGAQPTNFFTVSGLPNLESGSVPVAPPPFTQTSVVATSFNTNGSWSGQTSTGGIVSNTWFTPTTAGIGSSYWIRFTLVSQSGPAFMTFNLTGVPTVWTSLSTQLNTQMTLVDTPGGSQTDSATRVWNVEIASDAAGTNIVATKFNWTWDCSVRPPLFSSVSISGISNINGVVNGTSQPGTPSFSLINFEPDGTYNIQATGFSFPPGNWGTPTSVGSGSRYWIRFTQTGASGTAGTLTGTLDTWLNISSTKQWKFLMPPGIGARPYSGNRTFTIEIATNSSGTTIVATKTDFVMSAGIL